jgi:ketosteroid isomerase-like protein
MAGGLALADIHPAVEAGVNNKNLDGLMARYAPDATMVLMDGATVTRTAAIREQWAGILEMKGRMTIRSRSAIEAGGLAVLSNERMLAVGDQRMRAVTAELARRPPVGGWLYVVDHPFASLEPQELAALAVAVEG